ncbi:DUF2267 domain-containing protein [Geotalea sp. SG265]|uniref:DUF2267 domain-containing protein n=1 Tax=Geotalea sp. SG265 TaxID=2922867 RepID=UPI001FAF4700|nr:DUF2267 domain-containing protein [Geotalea sp. SG265]
MDYHQFIKNVQEQAGCDKEQTERAVRATLQTLGERLFMGEADQLAAQLPRELQPYLKEVESRSKMELDEFLQRIARREGTDAENAERHATAVLSVLGNAVSGGEMEDVVSQLPKKYLKLFGKWSKTIH